ncbi:hypothetical protein CK203_057416 [Vitis vinifera]|uniref:Reverse transcriptase domain-containing protein n=1 Tax=Vitis vinifera TaxID=29760 RepID=A0A438FUF3_VITVI|nr:hypothetical protein CK203_057416 [Vitis vinifera]
MLNWEDLKARKTLKNGSMEAACEQYEILQISFDTFANVLRNQHLQRRKSNAFHSAGKSLMLHIYINDIGDWAPVIYASRLVRYHLSKVEEHEVQGGVAKAFQNLLTEAGEWRPSLNGLVFERIEGEGAARLEKAFSVEEVVSALSDLSGDKVPGLGGAEDLRDFRPISLVGGLLAKVLDKRLKKVAGKVVYLSQNAFVEGKQILDATLIANKAIDSLLNSNESGVLCKLEIKMAYDHLNWDFFAPELIWTKSEILPMGRVENLEELALELGYLGLPLGASHNSIVVWDGVEESMPIYISLLCMLKVVRLRPEQIQRDFLWSEGDFELKIHLVNWCFIEEREALWKQVISRKFGVEEGRWYTCEDKWCGDEALCDSFPSLYALVVSKEKWVAEVWDPSIEGGCWSLHFSRPFNNWEVDLVEQLLLTIQVWKERNRIAFDNEELSLHRMKNSFVHSFWSWTKL